MTCLRLSGRSPFPRALRTGSVAVVSDAAHPHDDGPTGTSLLPPRMSAEQIATSPPVDDLDALLIDDLTTDEFNAFLDAINA